MNFSILALIGILLIIIEMYFPDFARKLETFIITFPKMILEKIFGVSYNSKKDEYDISDKVGCVFGIIGILSIIYFVIFFGFGLIGTHPTLSFVVGWIIALPIALYIWTHIANFIFIIFNFITNKKPFAGIGLLVAVIDGII